MKSGSSAPISAGGQSSDTFAARSSYQKSRPACMAHWPPVRLITTTFSSPSDLVSASSVLCLSLIFLPPRKPFIGGDDELRLAIGDAAGKRVRREAAEHHGMNGADPRAGEHGVGRLGDHRQIDGDAVAAC